MGEHSVRWAWERAFRDAEIGKGATYAVGFALATFADKRGGSIHPGQDGLASRLGLSKSTVRRALGDLEGAGWVARVGTPNRAEGEAQEFRLAYPPQCPPVNTDGQCSPIDTEDHGSGGSVSISAGVSVHPGADQCPPVDTQQTIYNNPSTTDQVNPPDPTVEQLILMAPPFDDDEESGGEVETIVPVEPESPLDGVTDRERLTRERVHARMLRDEGYRGDDDPSMRKPGPARTRHRS